MTKWTISLPIVPQMGLDFTRPHVRFLAHLNLLTSNTPDRYTCLLLSDNYPQPGKRPLSSMAPTVIEQPDGRLHLIVGGSGGSRIFGAIVQVILGLDWGMDVSAAVEQPRVHDQLFPQFVDIESEMDPTEVDALAAKGHLTFGS